jgi:hypothetical protein
MTLNSVALKSLPSYLVVILTSLGESPTVVGVIKVWMGG